MVARVMEFRNKEVINIKDGTKLGFVDDLEIDTESAQVLSVIVFGRLKCFGLFGREDDIIICWKEIQVIGEDAILVCFTNEPKKPRRKGFWKRVFK
ncbi:MAG: YlmC/YmxH family sporulation protein [Oscillospiraceae bacterium]|jgi:YlmC/YmxH family sporulation protein|nr:YlmC/YmxH family sporulation protein [Oscillospiraceae bacterium]